MNTACGCLKSMCVRPRDLSAGVDTTNNAPNDQCLYFSFASSGRNLRAGGLETGPCPTFRKGNPLRGNERLGPNCGKGKAVGRFSTGTSPRWKM